MRSVLAVLLALGVLACGEASRRGKARPLRFEPAPGAPFAAAPRAGRPSLSDLDRDGHLDLAVPCEGQGRTFLYRGLGGGRLALAGPPLRASEEGSHVEIADVDEDGLSDLVTPDAKRGAIAVLLQRR